MRRRLAALPLLFLAACDLGLGTGPGELVLDDLPAPGPNQAVLVITRDIGDGRGYYDMHAEQEYFLQLREPPPLPQLVYDAPIGVGAAVLRLVLADIEQTGTLVTGTDGVEVAFVGPDGTVYEPTTTCRVTITSAWSPTPGTRLTGKSDCPVTNGEIRFRVMFRFDYTVPPG